MALINKTFKNIIVFDFIYIFNFTVSAQINLCEGLYVNTKGDTIKGKIDNQNWVSTPKSIGFTSTGLEEDIKILTPKEVKFFKIIRKDKFEEIFVSRNVKLELSSININYITYENKPIWSEKEDLFLKLLVKGRLTLYIYHDDIKKDNYYISKDHYFIEDEKGSIETLLFKKYLTNDNILKTNAGFKSQLSERISDCPKIDITDINKLQFKYKPLTAFVKEYNKCFNDKNDYQFKAEKRPKEFGLFTGAFATSIEMSVSTLPYKVFPTLGLYAKFPLALTSPKINIVCELHPVFYEGATRYIYFFPDKSEFEAKDRFKYSVARLNIMVSYTRHLSNNTSIAIYGGISEGYIFKNITNRYYVRQKDFVGGIRIEESDVYKSTAFARRNEQGFLFGAKYRIGKLGIDLRFAKTNGWEARPLFHTFVQSIGLSSSYAF
jgi:hypothetical protein